MHFILLVVCLVNCLVFIVADEFPGAEVRGFDLNAIQPLWVPPNLSFCLDDVEKRGWELELSQPSYIFSRDLILAIKDWPSVLRRAYELVSTILPFRIQDCLTVPNRRLPPGGWIELQFLEHRVASDNKPVDPDHAVPRFWEFVNQGLSALGVDCSLCNKDSVARMLRDQGFTDIVERTFKIPQGIWTADTSLKTVGMYWCMFCANSAKSIGQFPLKQGLQWEQERVDMEISLFCKAMRGRDDLNSKLMYMPFRVVYGQKPTQTVQLETAADRRTS